MPKREIHLQPVVDWMDVGSLAELASGTLFPRRAEVTVMGDVGPWVTVRFEVEDGQPVVTWLALSRAPGGGGPVTPAVVRSLPLAAYVEAATRAAAAAGHLRQLRDEPIDDRDYAESVLRRRHTMNDKLLRKVAEVVLANPDAPTLEVSRQLHTSHRNATRWIKAARERGLLEEN